MSLDNRDFEVFVRQVADELIDRNWDVETIEPSQCQSCSYPIGSGFKFCSNCGKRIEDIPCNTSLHELDSAIKQALLKLGLVINHDD